ncbi:M12 family metallopeptidase [Aquimarina hainanensis]|uniref:M12 family metallopeptidase n=1 Tax=Aquimarina hainanensis TaxID=1578017 RepID=A0ABW5N1R0_9FLAO
MKFKQSLLLLGTALAVVACSEDEQSQTPQLIDSETAATDLTEKAYFSQNGMVNEGYYEGMKVAYETINGDHIFEGDIILSEKDIYKNDTHYVIEQGAPVPLTKSVGRTSGRWPNNTVYYTVQSDLPNQSRVTDAINHWETRTNLKFVKRTNQPNYIYFRSGNGCSSSVGMVGGRQNINLSTRCSTGNTIHEIGHAIGLWHEQSRTDRDRFLTINFNNIESGKQHNFQTYAERGRDGDEYTTSLDFGSIMMYGPTAFSKNGQPTIVKKDGGSYRAQRNALSADDLKGINKMYPGDGGGGPVYVNGQYYTVHGLRVYRYNDKWYYYSSRNGWRQVVYVNGAWRYA